MNIFYLSTDPLEAASMQCNKHVVKMTVETAQILSTVQHLLGGVGPLKPTHAKHPCVLWATQSAENYSWLYQHFLGLLKEYTTRYKKIHAYTRLVQDLVRNETLHFRSTGFTEPPLCMPEQYKGQDAVESYRSYYQGDKARFAVWPEGKTPIWFQYSVVKSLNS